MVETIFNLQVLVQALPLLLRGLVVTVLLAAGAMILGGALGVALCLGRLNGGPLLRGLAGGWIDLFRALPLLVLLILIYGVLPFAGIAVPGFVAALIGLGLVFSAEAAEALRAAVEGLPRGQVEAARALGVADAAVLRDILMPQAVGAALPVLAAQGVGLAKDTALASVVAVPDLLRQAMDAQRLAANPTPLIAAALIYLAVLLPALRLVRALERGTAR